MADSTIVNLSRLVALERNLDVVANNVANIETTGFRARQPTFQEYLSPSDDSEPGKREPPVSLVDTGLSYADTARGAIRLTGNPLDVAINGEAYFAIQTEAGELYTRDGSFTLDNTGRLVTEGGKPVMTESGALTVPLREGNITIGADGTISNKNGVLGRLRLVAFNSVGSLRPAGTNLLSADSQPFAVPPHSAQLVAGALETSNVQSVFEMSKLAEITRAYEIASSLLKDSQKYDDLNKLGNVPE